MNKECVNCQMMRTCCAARGIDPEHPEGMEVCEFFYPVPEKEEEKKQ